MRELPGCGVVVGELPLAAPDREVLRRRMVRARLAPVGVVRRPDRLGDPQAPLAVHHRVVGAVAPGRRALGAPVRRRHEIGGARVGVAARLHRGAGRHVHPHRAVGHRVGDDEPGSTDAVQRTVRIQVRIALVGGDLVVHHRHRVAPSPHRQHDVAFLPLRAGGRRRDLAGRDAVGPVGEQVQRALAPHAVQPGAHARSAPPHLHAVLPRVQGRVEVVHVQHRHLAGRDVAHLVAELVAVLQAIDPLGLMAYGPADAVAVRPGARELARGRHLQQRVPVVGGVDARGLLRRDRRGHREGHLVAGPRRLLRGIHEAVAADPQLVAGVRQVRHEEAPVVAGDHDLAKRGLEVAGLGDDPDAGLTAAGALHDAADVLAGRRRARAGQQEDAARQEHRSRETDSRCPSHVNLLEPPVPPQWLTVYVTRRQNGSPMWGGPAAPAQLQTREENVAASWDSRRTAAPGACGRRDRGRPTLHPFVEAPPPRYRDSPCVHRRPALAALPWLRW